MHQTLRIEHAVVSLQAASCYIQFIHETLFYSLDPAMSIFCNNVHLWKSYFIIKKSIPSYETFCISGITVLNPVKNPENIDYR
jgi:hypothetical protein